MTQPTVAISAGIEWTRYTGDSLATALDSVASLGFTSLNAALDWSAYVRSDQSFDFSSGERSLRGFLQLATQRGLRVHFRLGPGCVESVRAHGVPSSVRDNRDCYETRAQRAPVLHVVRGRIEPRLAWDSPTYARLACEWIAAASSAIQQAAQSAEATITVTVGHGTSPLFYQPNPAVATRFTQALLDALDPALVATTPSRVAYTGPPSREPVFEQLSQQWPLDVALPWATAGKSVIAGAVAHGVRACTHGVDFAVACATPGLLRPIPLAHAMECAQLAVEHGARSLTFLGIAGGDRHVGAVIDERGETRSDAALVQEFLRTAAQIERDKEEHAPLCAPETLGVTRPWLAQLGFVKTP